MVQTPRDAARSRTSILDAAERLLAERGPDEMTLERVGTAAGLSRGAPAYFFGSKAALQAAVLERCRDRLVRAIEHAVLEAATQSPARLLASGVGAYADALAADPTGARVLLWDLLRSDAPFAAAAGAAPLLALETALLGRLGNVPDAADRIRALLECVAGAAWLSASAASPLVHREHLVRLALRLAADLVSGRA
jgi:AcrR family transcriptional regulator